MNFNLTYKLNLETSLKVIKKILVIIIKLQEYRLITVEHLETKDHNFYWLHSAEKVTLQLL